MSDAHAATRASWAQLSPEYLFFKAKARDGTTPAAGARLHSMRDAIQHEGQPLEIAWPYLPSLPTDLAKWKPPPTIGEVFRRTTDLIRSDFSAVWDCLSTGRPALLGISISTAFYAPALGVVDSDEAIEPIRRHAVVAVATGADFGKRYVMVRNSWGESWGTSGHAWVSERYLAPRLLAAMVFREDV